VYGLPRCALDGDRSDLVAERRRCFIGSRYDDGYEFRPGVRETTFSMCKVARRSEKCCDDGMRMATFVDRARCLVKAVQLAERNAVRDANPRDNRATVQV
jgi:hypothetical protein